ncbi:hypothetical protein Sjap_003009 [Stephania japonica]|uniref:Uncharacterized protein n=1 Tax=Stephania japonica TaxID=461633 RepID=A0AAP0PV20_9MAGN
MNNKVNEVMERQKVMEEIISQLTSTMSHRDDNGNLEGKPCKLLHWIASGEVVAYGEISSTDPSALVDDVPLGPDRYKVWVRDVLISNIALPRPSRLHFTVDDAMDMSQPTPTQESAAKDLHGFEWRLKHKFRELNQGEVLGRRLELEQVRNRRIQQGWAGQHDNLANDRVSVDSGGSKDGLGFSAWLVPKWAKLDKVGQGSGKTRARLGKAGQGLAWHGQGRARLDKAGQGSDKIRARLRKVGQGLVRHGQSLTRLGKAGQGLVRLGKARAKLSKAGQGTGKAWQGWARLGNAR